MTSRDSTDPTFTPNVDSTFLLILSDSERIEQVGPSYHDCDF